MIPIELSILTVRKQMERMHASMGMEPGSAPQPQEAQNSPKRRTAKFPERLGAALIHAGNTLVHYAHRHEVPAH